MIYFFIGIVCLGLGFIFGKRFSPKTTYGNLVFDYSDPDGPYMFLELTTSIVEVSNKDEVLFKVIHKNYISQK